MSACLADPSLAYLASSEEEHAVIIRHYTYFRDRLDVTSGSAPYVSYGAGPVRLAIDCLTHDPWHELYEFLCGQHRLLLFGHHTVIPVYVTHAEAEARLFDRPIFRFSPTSCGDFLPAPDPAAHQPTVRAFYRTAFFEDDNAWLALSDWYKDQGLPHAASLARRQHPSFQDTDPVPV